MIARVLIRNKRGVFDPEGKVVEGGLHRLGYDVQQVRVGKVVELQLSTDEDEDANRKNDVVVVRGRCRC